LVIQGKCAVVVTRSQNSMKVSRLSWRWKWIVNWLSNISNAFLLSELSFFLLCSVLLLCLSWSCYFVVFKFDFAPNWAMHAIMFFSWFMQSSYIFVFKSVTHYKLFNSYSDFHVLTDLISGAIEHKCFERLILNASL
jgi:hypothetical protein